MTVSHRLEVFRTRTVPPTPGRSVHGPSRRKVGRQSSMLPGTCTRRGGAGQSFPAWPLGSSIVDEIRGHRGSRRSADRLCAPVWWQPTTSSRSAYVVARSCSTWNVGSLGPTCFGVATAGAPAAASRLRSFRAAQAAGWRLALLLAATSRSTWNIVRAEVRTTGAWRVRRCVGGSGRRAGTPPRAPGPSHPRPRGARPRGVPTGPDPPRAIAPDRARVAR